ncbi:MAG: GAF domain-containing protein, partial [Gloeomargaritaceae cyanobacterium C42_A2020_066]|nr:GAF domain-containing protein [Gloeomargaritaceae cyanobacterium C42_A2020_066]
MTQTPPQPPLTGRDPSSSLVPPPPPNGRPAVRLPVDALETPLPPVTLPQGRPLGQLVTTLAVTAGLFSGLGAGIATYVAVGQAPGETRLERPAGWGAAIGLGGVAGLVIGGAAAALLNRRVTRPIQNLAAAAGRLGAGDLESAIPLPDTDELGQVAGQLGHLAHQIRNLETQTQAETARTQLYRDLILKIRRSLNPHDILDTTVREVRQALKADRVVVYRFDSQWVGTVIAESVARGWTPALQEKIDDPCFRGRYIDAYRNGRVQAVNDVQTAGLQDCHLKILERFQVRANLVAPLLKDDQLLGLLIAHQCAEPREWRPAEVDFFSQVALQVGYALDQALLLQDQAAKTNQARLLNTLTLRIRESLSVTAIYDTAVREVREALQSDRCVVYLFDEHWQGTIVAESVVGAYPRALGAQITDPCFADRYVEQYQRGRVQATPDIHNAGLTEC